MQCSKFLLATVASAAMFAQLPALAQDAEEGDRESAVDRVLQKVTVSATKKRTSKTSRTFRFL